MNCTLKLNKTIRFIKRITIPQDEAFLWVPVLIALGAFCVLCNNYLALLCAVPLFLTDKKLLIILAILLGILSAHIRLKSLSHIVMLKKNIEATTITGTVIDCEHVNKGIRFILSTKLGNIRLNWKGKYDDSITTPGNKIRVLAKVFSIKKKASPFAFDFRRHAYFNKFCAGGVVLKKPDLISQTLGFKIFFKQIRDKLNTRIFSIFHRDIANISAALLTGNKAGISEEVRSIFIRSGIAHILAISGLHVSLVGGFVFLLIRLFLCLFKQTVLRHNPKKIAIIFSFLTSLLYTLVANGGIPATRAIIMHLIITCAVLLDKNPLALRNVSVAATIILLISPEVIFSPGFYMSFFAVLSLIFFYNNHTLVGKNYFAKIIVSSAIASTAVMPFSLYFFNNITINSIPANLIAIPLTGTILIPALLCFSVGLEGIPCYLINKATTLLIETARFFSSWKYSYLLLPSPPDITIQIIGIGMLLIFLSKQHIAGISLILVATTIYCISPMPCIFINRNADVFGIYTKGRLYVSSLIKDRSSSSSWVVSLGLNRKGKLLHINNTYSMNGILIRDDGEHIFVKKDIKINKAEIIQNGGCVVMPNNKIIFSNKNNTLPWI